MTTVNPSPPSDDLAEEKMSSSRAASKTASYPETIQYPPFASLHATGCSERSAR